MNHTDQRNRLRALLNGSKCLSPACVYDPLSARVAEVVGYEMGILAGRIASYAVLAAPNLMLLTLTELADQIRRITRVSKLSLIVDADHGYGNALNVMRTIQEVEHAGGAALTIEDTALPRRFGQPEKTEELISVEEMVGKLRAAIAARADPTLVIAGRTSALKIEGTEHTITRVKAYAATGVDAIFLQGLDTLEQIDAIHAAVKLPIILAGVSTLLAPEDLAARGARVQMRSHQPITVAVKALYEAYSHLFNEGSPVDLKAREATGRQMAVLVGDENYKQWQSEYLR